MTFLDTPFASAVVVGNLGRRPDLIQFYWPELESVVVEPPFGASISNGTVAFSSHAHLNAGDNRRVHWIHMGKLYDRRGCLPQESYVADQTFDYSPGDVREEFSGNVGARTELAGVSLDLGNCRTAHETLVRLLAFYDRWMDGGLHDSVATWSATWPPRSVTAELDQSLDLSLAAMSVGQRNETDHSNVSEEYVRRRYMQLPEWRPWRRDLDYFLQSDSEREKNDSSEKREKNSVSGGCVGRLTL